MAPKKAATPIFANKEDGQFREALKLYDSKQYKKALKLVDQTLKKNLAHAELAALKGCLNFQLGHKDDAEPYITKAIAKEPNNFLVCHLAGIYYRSVENYPEAAKWLKALMDNGLPNKPILRDLALLQLQVRDYKHLKELRQQYLESQPGYRANWTGVAVLHHLAGDPKQAVLTLVKIEDLIKPHMTDADKYEHLECVLYKVLLIAELGDYQQALETLETDSESILDRLSFHEYKAKYLMLLGRKDEAATEYRRLLQRNPDNAGYYKLLETALGTSNADFVVRYSLYQKLALFYPKLDPPAFLPLTFLPADLPQFAELARNYVIGQLKRGVPLTFVNVKPIYKNKAKRAVIEGLVTDFYETQVPELEKKNPTIRVWTQYFLAQNYLYQGHYDQAQRYVDLALKHSPTLVELYILKARITKHQGKPQEAAQIMDEGRQLDLQDRFVNSKATKYLLRADRVDDAVATISLFTKLDDDAVNGCKDLHLMQVNWLLVESGEAYTRLYREAQAVDDEEHQELAELYRGLAFKRFHSVVKVFETFYNDQYDFHLYCMRRGTPRDYVATLKWEDRIHGTPIYVRAIKGLLDLYFDLAKAQQTAASATNGSTAAKKPQKKAKRKYTKKQKEWATKVELVKDDQDPFGVTAYDEVALAGNALDQLLTLVKPLLEEAKDYVTTWRVLFDIYLLQQKYVLALLALKQLARLGDDVTAKVATLKETVEGDSDANAAIKQVVAKGIDAAFG